MPYWDRLFRVLRAARAAWKDAPLLPPAAAPRAAEEPLIPAAFRPPRARPLPTAVTAKSKDWRIEDKNTWFLYTTEQRSARQDANKAPHEPQTSSDYAPSIFSGKFAIVSRARGWVDLSATDHAKILQPIGYRLYCLWAKEQANGQYWWPPSRKFFPILTTDLLGEDLYWVNGHAVMIFKSPEFFSAEDASRPIEHRIITQLVLPQPLFKLRQTFRVTPALTSQLRALKLGGEQ